MADVGQDRTEPNLSKKYRNKFPNVGKHAMQHKCKPEWEMLLDCYDASGYERLPCLAQYERMEQCISSAKTDAIRFKAMNYHLKQFVTQRKRFKLK